MVRFETEFDQLYSGSSSGSEDELEIKPITTNGMIFYSQLQNFYMIKNRCYGKNTEQITKSPYLY